MHIIHVIAGIWQHTGGPAEVVPRLCASLVEHGCKITLITLDGPHSEAALECTRKGVDFRSYPVVGRGGMCYSPKMARALRQIAQQADIIHNHGLWLYPNWLAGTIARKLRKPLVITPHGVLTRGMLKRSRLKKSIAWALFDRHSVKYASVIQAFTEAELQQMEPRIRKKKVAVIPNGVEIWDLPDRGAFEKRYPQMCGKKILLFLARVHPIKGVFDLIDAWKTLSSSYPEWHLVIAGRPEAECVNKVEAKITEYDLQSSATLVGPQYSQYRLEAYASADAFVLPSYAEGFSTSILEAMACGLPVVYTTPCNFPEAAGRGCGLVGDTGVKSLVQSLRTLMTMNDKERRTMGEKARALIEQKYTWPKVAIRMKNTYEWIIHGGSTPSWIEVV